MKNGINKFMKGMIAIFAIKLVLFGGVFIFQSCQESDSLEGENVILAKSDFRNSINMSIKNLNGIMVSDKVKGNIYSRNGEEMAELQLYAEEGSNISEYYNYDTSLLLGDLVNIGGTDLMVKYPDGRESDNITENQELLGTYQISVQEAQTSLQPTLIEAKNYLYAKGLTDLDIQNLLAADAEGPAMSESDLIPLVMQLIAEEQNQGLTTNIDYLSLFGTSAHASQIGECAGDALGISAIAAVVNEGLHTSAGKALLKKALRKVASRALGWVGAAIFVYEFGDCMDWW